MSCENESQDNSDSTQLSKIIENFYLNNSTESSTTEFIIENNENIEIVYSSGMEVLSFTDNVMTTSEYYNQINVLVSIQEFEYNINKQLISIASYNVEDGTSILENKRTFEYISNEILSTDVYYNSDGSVLDTAESNIFTLNSNNEIIKFENPNFGGVWEATYSNGNLASIIVSGYGNKDGSGMFNFTSEFATDTYQKEKFRFGLQWRVNIMLYNQVGGYSFKQLAELGDNYLLNYSYTDLGGNETVSLNVSYEFNEQGRLSKQTKNKLFFSVPHDRILTYVYE